MSHIFVRSELIIEARPGEVFQTLADYKMKRPRILPPNYQDYTIEQGGQGSGTVIRYRFQAAGRARDYEMHVEETIQRPGAHRTRQRFIAGHALVCAASGRRSEKQGLSGKRLGRRNGIDGFFERTFAPLGLSSIYQTSWSHWP